MATMATAKTTRTTPSPRVTWNLVPSQPPQELPTASAAPASQRTSLQSANTANDGTMHMPITKTLCMFVRTRSSCSSPRASAMKVKPAPAWMKPP
jgi:hypothetical protein